MNNLEFLKTEEKSFATPISHNGMTALKIDNDIVYPMIMMSPWGEGERTERGAKRIKNTADIGIHLYVTQQFLDLKDFTEMWYGYGSYNFDMLKQNLESIIKNDNKARIIIKMYVQPPLWWMKDNPLEAVVYSDNFIPKGDNVFCGGDEGLFPSFASDKWLSDTGEMLKALIRFIESEPCGKRVIGINLLNGVCQEWHYWGSINNHLPDKSTCMQLKFKEYLKNKYKTNENLQKVWNMPSVTFESAEIPGIEKRDNSEFLYFRDPLKEAPVIDYYRCQHEATCNAILYFAGIVKGESHGRLMAGAYYGYYFTCPWYNDGISMEVSSVLQSPLIDFLASPAAYEDWLSRGVGGDSLLRGLPESCRLYGKIYISETDEGTYACPKVYHECERMNNFEESVANLKKEFGSLLVRRAGNWWFDLDDSYGLFMHKPHKDELSFLKRIADYAVNTEKKNNEAALVVSMESLYYTSHSMGEYIYENNDMTAHLLARCGLAYDIITDKEISLSNCPDYKLYIFSGFCFADNATRKLVLEKLSKNGATALWIYGAGIMDENGIDENIASELTGISIGIIKENVIQSVAIDRKSVSKLMPLNFSGTVKSIKIPSKTENYLEKYGMEEEISYGTNKNYGPVIFANDKNALCLGKIKETDLCGLALKKRGNVTNIFSSCPITSTELLRGIARLAGVHIYHSSDEVFMIDNQFICFPVRDNTEEKEVILPCKSDVRDLVSGEILFRNTDIFHFTPKKRTTYLFEYVKSSG